VIVFPILLLFSVGTSLGAWYFSPRKKDDQKLCSWSWTRSWTIVSLPLLYLVGDGSVVFLVLDKFLNIYCLECMGIINRNLQIFTGGSMILIALHCLLTIKNPSKKFWAAYWRFNRFRNFLGWCLSFQHHLHLLPYN
jgi:hypothetical protein